jgi:uncharacterized protein
MYCVIFHLDEADEYQMNLTLNNITNLLADLDEVEVELVVYDQGVMLYLPEGNHHVKHLKNLQKKGVRLVVCNNTMQSRDLKPADLVEGVEVVSSGVGELVRKQKEGWIYIRP